jgi:hypothetical protein
LTLGASTTSLLAQANVSQTPFVSSTPNGFRLYNPGTTALKYELVEANGRHVVSQGRLSAGESHALPNSTQGLLVRFLE